MKNTASDIIAPLNPADYFTLAMDQEIRADGLAGNYALFGLHLSCQPQLDELQRRIDEFSQRFPTAGACLRQRGKRFYWCRREVPASLLYLHQRPKQTDETAFQQTVINQVMNRQQDRESLNPVEFHLISGPDKSLFFIRWLHVFTDARGADLILKYLCNDDTQQRSLYGNDESSLVEQHLDKYNLLHKLLLFFKAKRYISRLDKYRSVMPVVPATSAQQLMHRVFRLSPEQTARVAAQARQSVGLTGTSLYYIGCLMRTLEQMSEDSNGQAYCAPYAFNLRRQRAITPVTGNHLSALFGQAPRELVNDRARLFAHLKQQNSQVIRDQLDYAILPLMWAGSWLDLDKYGKILRLSGPEQLERSSFWFSDIGQLDIGQYALAGAAIDDVFHSCQVSSPPGLALLCCVFNKQLILSYNFIHPGYNEAWIQQLHDRMLNELLHDS